MQYGTNTLKMKERNRKIWERNRGTSEMADRVMQKFYWLFYCCWRWVTYSKKICYIIMLHIAHWGQLKWVMVQIVFVPLFCSSSSSLQVDINAVSKIKSIKLLANETKRNNGIWRHQTAKVNGSKSNYRQNWWNFVDQWQNRNKL